MNRPAFRKISFLLMITAFVLTACASDALTTQVAEQSTGTIENHTDGSEKIIGISLPTDSDPRWLTDGEIMRNALTDRGYQVVLNYANAKPQTQLNQIQQMIESGVSILVITPIESGLLSPVLRAAHESGVLIIGYDRSITQTADIDFLVTFNHEEAGFLLGRQLVQSMGLDTGNGPFTIEFFLGDPKDSNTRVYYDASLSVLQPYIDQGKLFVQSQEMEFTKVTIENQEAVSARVRMNGLLEDFYPRSRVDCILSTADPLSLGVLASLRNAEYGTPAQPWPIITGIGAEVESVKAIIAGEQTFTILMNHHELARQAAGMVHAVLQGQKVPVNNTTSYFNGVRIVPALEVLPLSIDLQNYEEMLIKSNYLTKDELELP